MWLCETLCLILCDTIKLCLTLCDSKWHRFFYTLIESVWLFVTLLASLCLCMNLCALFSSVGLCMTLCDTVWLCLSLYNFELMWFSLFLAPICHTWLWFDLFLKTNDFNRLCLAIPLFELTGRGGWCYMSSGFFLYGLGRGLLSDIGNGPTISFSGK